MVIPKFGRVIQNLGGRSKISEGNLKFGKENQNLGGKSKVWGKKPKIWEGNPKFWRESRSLGRKSKIWEGNPKFGKENQNLGGKSKVWEGDLKFGREIQNYGGKSKISEGNSKCSKSRPGWMILEQPGIRRRDPGPWQGLGMDLLEDLPTQTLLGFWDPMAEGLWSLWSLSQSFFPWIWIMKGEVWIFGTFPHGKGSSSPVPIPRGIGNPCGCGPWGQGSVLGMVGLRDLGALFQPQYSMNSH